MAAGLERISVKERLAALISGDVVQAALFSTFTFNRRHFETEILGGLLGPNSGGAGLGRFPVTVMMDASQFRGQGRGYDVILCHGRLWHAKVVCLMVGSDSPRTILLVGSGNLTPSGWESNLELFSSQVLAGWTLPHAVEDLFSVKTLPRHGSGFVNWYRSAKDRPIASRIDRRYVSSATGVPIWGQWDWEGPWHEAHVVSPFLDNATEEGTRCNEEPTQFFEALGSRNGKGKLNLYLRDAGKDNGAAVAPWRTIRSLSRRFELRVFRSTEGGPLHAKLYAVRLNKKWHVLGGSPNASGWAMIRRDGNVELAWLCDDVSKGDVSSLLPEARAVAIARSNFVEPEITRNKPPWMAVERAAYHPRTRRIEIRWAKGHGPFDTELLWENERVLDGQVVREPGIDRALQMRPWNTLHRRAFRKGWVPIEWPRGCSDSNELDVTVSFLDLLAIGAAEDLGEPVSRGARFPGGPRRLHQQPVGNQDFPWKERVDKLRSALDHIEGRLTECASVGRPRDQEVDYHCRLVARMFASADHECRALPGDSLERTFREWSKAELLAWVRNYDRRTRSAKLLRSLSRGWPGRIHELLA